MRGIRQNGGVLKNVWLGRGSRRKGTKRTGFGERGKNYTKELRLRRKRNTQGEMNKHRQEEMRAAPGGMTLLSGATTYGLSG